MTELTCHVCKGVDWTEEKVERKTIDSDYRPLPYDVMRTTNMCKACGHRCITTKALHMQVTGNFGDIPLSRNTHRIIKAIFDRKV